MNSRVSSIIQTGASVVFALASVALVFSAAAQVTTTFQTDGGEWNTAANWNSGVPGMSDTAVIGNGRTAVLSGAASGVSALNLGDATGSGTLILSNALFSAGIPSVNVGMAASSTGTLIQTGGTLTNTALYVGKGAGVTGVYRLYGGTNVLASTTSFGENGGLGMLRMEGGLMVQLSSSTSDVYLGGGSGGGAFNGFLSGGSFMCNKDLYLGAKKLNGQGAVYSGDATLAITDGGYFKSQFLKIYQARIVVTNGTLAGTGNGAINFAPDGNQRTNRVELVGGNSQCLATKAITLGSNTTVRLVLDDTCTSDTKFLRQNGSSNGGTSSIKGVLRIGRRSGCYNLPSSVVVFESVTGTGLFSGTFDQVVWEDGLTGTVTYSEDAKTILLENIVAPSAGTVLYLF